MDAPLVCDGATVGALHVPPFELRRGGCICLHLPSPITDDMERLVATLTGRAPLPGIHIHGRVLSAITGIDLPIPGRFLRIFYRPRIESWLRKKGISAEEIKRILARHGWTSSTRVENLPGTPKTFLALEAAWAQDAEGIVFTTMGLGPLGEMRVNEAVLQHLDYCPAIHLSTQYTSNGEVGRRCFKPATCLELVAADSPALASGRT
jgi:hypothetical protein